MLESRAVCMIWNLPYSVVIARVLFVTLVTLTVLPSTLMRYQPLSQPLLQPASAVPRASGRKGENKGPDTLIMMPEYASILYYCIKSKR